MSTHAEAFPESHSRRRPATTSGARFVSLILVQPVTVRANSASAAAWRSFMRVGLAELANGLQRPFRRQTRRRWNRSRSSPRKLSQRKGPRLRLISGGKEQVGLVQRVRVLKWLETDLLNADSVAILKLRTIRDEPYNCGNQRGTSDCPFFDAAKVFQIDQSHLQQLR